MGFPLLNCQLLFINGMVIGYHAEKGLGYIAERKNGLLICLVGLVSLVSLVLLIWAMVKGRELFPVIPR